MAGYILQQFLKTAGFFTDGHHINEHRGKIFGRTQRVRNTVPFGQTLLDAFQFTGNCSIAEGVAQNIHGLQNTHAAGLQDGKNAGETGHGAFPEQRSHEGQFHHSRIKNVLAPICFQIKIKRPPPDHQNEDCDVPVIDEEFIHEYTDLSRQREFQAGTFENTDKTGYDGRQQHNKGQKQKTNNDERIRHGGLNVRFNLVLMFNDIDQPIEHFV